MILILTRNVVKVFCIAFQRSFSFRIEPHKSCLNQVDCCALWFPIIINSVFEKHLDKINDRLLCYCSQEHLYNADRKMFEIVTLKLRRCAKRLGNIVKILRRMSICRIWVILSETYIINAKIKAVKKKYKLRARKSFYIVLDLFSQIVKYFIEIVFLYYVNAMFVTMMPTEMMSSNLISSF